MPTATCHQVNEYETVTRMCCFSKSVLVCRHFTVSVDGASVIAGDLQFNVGNGTPNIENVARTATAAGTPRSVFLLTAYMLAYLEAGNQFNTVRVAAAHNGVLALDRAGFVAKTHHVGKALALAGQELECTTIGAARLACLALFNASNPGYVIN